MKRLRHKERRKKFPFGNETPFPVVGDPGPDTDPVAVACAAIAGLSVGATIPFMHDRARKRNGTWLKFLGYAWQFRGNHPTYRIPAQFALNTLQSVRVSRGWDARDAKKAEHRRKTDERAAAARAKRAAEDLQGATG